ncbi:MAG TPA: tetratricopeptide repeat protein [Blastocatellia bacterium]|nr:tetratricopeptide repeat protein [Blastocatellia bacterium]
MVQRSALRNTFRRVVGGGVGLLITLLIGSSLIRTAHTAQTLSFQQDKAGAGAAAPSEGETQALEPGRSIDRELSNGQSHCYRIRLDAGKYLRVHVEQQGIDVTVTLLTPDGKVAAESKRDNGNYGPEIVSFAAERPIEVRLEVRPPAWEAPAGRYEVKIAELRAANEKDRKRVDAERTFAEGERLLEQGRAETTVQAGVKYEAALQLYRSADDIGGEAASANKIGQAYNLRSERQKALDAFSQALRLYQSLGDGGGEATTLNNVGWIYFQMGERKKALDCFNQALSLSRDAGNRLAESLVLRNLGNYYRARGEIQKALDYFDQSLRLNRVVGPRGGEAVILNYFGIVYNSIEDRQKALKYYNQASQIFRAVRDLRGEAFALGNIGTVYSSLGEDYEALDYQKQSLSLIRAIGDRKNEAAILNSIGNIHRRMGEIQSALENLQQSLLIRREVSDRGGVAIALNSLGNLYESIGEKQNALDYYNQSMAIMREFNHPEGVATILNNIGVIYSDLGENQKALDAYSESLAIQRETNDRQGVGLTLSNIGLFYAESGDNRKALDYFDQSLQLRRVVDDLAGEAVTLINIGSVRLSLGAREAALELFDQALRLSRKMGNPVFEASALMGIAKAERDRGNLTEARGKIEGALKIVESLRTKIDAGELRASYRGANQSYYEFYVDLLMRLHRLDPSKNYAAAAFQVSERSRARALIETLAEFRAGIRNGIDPELPARERALLHRIESKTDRLIRLLCGKHTEERAASVRSEIEALEIEYQQLQSKIRASSPRYAALTQPQPLTLAEIQDQALNADTLLLEYALGEERSYLWAVTQNSFTAHELPCRKEIEEAALRVRDLMTARNRIVKFEEPHERQARISKAAAEYPKAAAALSHLLLGPVVGQLEKKRLLIVGDGVLQYVSFAALPSPEIWTKIRSDEGAEGKSYREKLRPSVPPSLRASVSKSLRPSVPLIVDHEIVSLPSASALAVLRRELAGRKPAPKTVAVLADPVFEIDDDRLKASIVSQTPKPAEVSKTRASALSLSDLTRSARDLRLGGDEYHLPRLPFTRKEAQTIFSLVPAGQRFVALDFAANQTAATSDVLAQYRYVHFATHGLLNSKHPELSGIVLSLFNEQGAEQEGFLRAHEVFNLNLPAELVVLSGCQTGLGRDVRGEGVVGLTRGFMYAGAARVLVSLWDVNDQATSELMGRLYSGMLGKKRLSPAAALREAQLSLWRENRWRAPYYWAGFTLQGEPR